MDIFFKPGCRKLILLNSGFIFYVVGIFILNWGCYQLLGKQNYEEAAVCGIDRDLDPYRLHLYKVPAKNLRTGEN